MIEIVAGGGWKASSTHEVVEFAGPVAFHATCSDIQQTKGIFLPQLNIRRLLLIMVSLVLLSACSMRGGSSSSTRTPVQTGPTQTGSNVRPTASSATGTAQSGTPDAVSLDPPLLVAHATSGTQQANYGTFYWMLDNGLAAQVNARGIEIQKDALHVTKGETIQFTWTNQNSKSDSTLQDLTISVFPEEQSIVTETSGQGTLRGFKASDKPVTTGKLSASNPTWTVSVDSGSYFIDVQATWSNPVLAEKTRHCEYGFLFTVG